MHNDEINDDREIKIRQNQLMHVMLAYCLYNQTLANKLDPWLERVDRGMRCQYRQQIIQTLSHSFSTATKFAKYHPGYNGQFEPIAYNYYLIDPHKPTFSFDLDVFRFFSPPKEITSTIDNTYLCIRRNTNTKKITAESYDAFDIVPLTTGSSTSGQASLYCFEGQTGHQVKNLNPHQLEKQELEGEWSILGYVLHDPNSNELQIAFRGSQSGSPERSARLGLLHQRGNPDWVTDMSFRNLYSVPYLYRYGKICAGFALTILSCLPAISTILRTLVLTKSLKFSEKTHIRITGHSLGGALATVMAGALSGDSNYYRKILDEISGLKFYSRDLTISTSLYTFSAPVVGDVFYAASIQNLIKSRQKYSARATSPSDPVSSAAIPNLFLRRDVLLNPNLFSSIRSPSSPLLAPQKLQHPEENFFPIGEDISTLPNADTHHPIYLYNELYSPGKFKVDNITNKVTLNNSEKIKPWEQYQTLENLFRSHSFELVCKLIKEGVDLSYFSDLGKAFVQVYLNYHHERVSSLVRNWLNTKNSPTTTMIQQTLFYLEFLRNAKNKIGTKEESELLVKKSIDYLKNVKMYFKSHQGAKHLLLYVCFYAACFAVAYSSSPDTTFSELQSLGLNRNLYFLPNDRIIWNK